MSTSTVHVLIKRNENVVNFSKSLAGTDDLTKLRSVRSSLSQLQQEVNACLTEFVEEDRTKNNAKGDTCSVTNTDDFEDGDDEDSEEDDLHEQEPDSKKKKF